MNVGGKRSGLDPTATPAADGRHLPPPPPPSMAAGCFQAVAGQADRIVVVDTETTGVYPSDRVVEVALVTLDLDGEVIDEFDTLIDPGRDVGPTWIHGITASMLAGAPTFDDVCGEVAVRLHGAVVAAHNLPFDARMLAGEYGRLGLDVRITAGLDTLAMTRAKLEVACSAYGVELDGAHAALADARATAQLLVALADRCEGVACRPAVMPSGLAPHGRVRRRDRQPTTSAPAPYLARLTARLQHPEQQAKVTAYVDLLDRAMADLHLDGHERTQLRELAGELGLGAGEIDRAHRRWLDELIETACADDVVTAEEYDQLCRAAAALGVDQRVVDERTATFRTAERAVTLEGGTTVCFTGTPVDRHGQEVARDELVAHARQLGLEPVNSVTKSRCQLLVAADVASRSGKAAKARKYEIPIADALDFLTATPGGQLQVTSTGVAQRETLVCQRCQRAWSRPATSGKKPQRCPECATGTEQAVTSESTSPAATPTGTGRQRPPPLPSSPTSGPELVVAVDEAAGTETLSCTACGAHWRRERIRGRKPHTCPDCR